MSDIFGSLVTSRPFEVISLAASEHVRCVYGNDYSREQRFLLIV